MKYSIRVSLCAVAVWRWACPCGCTGGDKTHPEPSGCVTGSSPPSSAPGAPRLASAWSWRRGPCRPRAVPFPDQWGVVRVRAAARLQLRIALGQVACDIVVHRQRLVQHEQMLVAPVAGQRLGDLLRAGPDAPVAMLCQHLGPCLTPHKKPIAESISCVPIKHRVALQGGRFGIR